MPSKQPTSQAPATKGKPAPETKKATREVPDDTWVKVPREHVERVQQFIDLVRGQADAA